MKYTRYDNFDNAFIFIFRKFNVPLMRDSIVRIVNELDE